MTKLILKTVSVINMNDIDVVVRDAFGREYIIYPRQERKITVFWPTNGFKNCRVNEDKKEKEDK